MKRVLFLYGDSINYLIPKNTKLTLHCRLFVDYFGTFLRLHEAGKMLLLN